MAWLGKNNTLLDSGRRAATSFTIPSITAASTARGRWGPCCSIAPTGSTATILSRSSRENASLVYSDQYLFKIALQGPTALISANLTNQSDRSVKLNV